MADMPAIHDGDQESLAALWDDHQAAAWPVAVGDHEGELMTLDTVFGGCVVYVLEERHLDPQRVTILEDSLAELEALLPELPEEALGYFERLKRLGMVALAVGRQE